MNVLGRLFLISSQDRRKDRSFFVRCRRTYVLNNNMVYLIKVGRVYAASVVCIPFEGYSGIYKLIDLKIRDD